MTCVSSQFGMSGERSADPGGVALAWGQFVQVCAVLPVAIALLALAGWADQQLILARFGSQFIPMAPSTAVGLILLCVGIYVRARWPRWQAGRRLATTTAILVVGMMGVLLVGSIEGFSKALEHLLVNTPEVSEGPPIGHISPVGAMALVLAGLSLLVWCIPFSEAPPRPSIAGALALGVIIISMVVLQGYAYGTPLLYGGKTIPMALPTAISLLLCGIGLVAAAGPRAWPLRIMTGASVRARLSRVLLPTMVTLTIGGHWLAIELLNQGANPVLGMALASLLTIAAVGGSIVLIARSIGGRIDRTEAALRNSQAMLTETQEVSKVGGWEYDVASRRVAWTDEIYGIHEISRGSSLDSAEDFLAFYAAADRARATEAFERTITSGEPFDLELQLVTARGKRVRVRTVGHAEKIGGKVVRAYGTIMDITDQFRMREELRIAKEAAESASHAKDQFLARLSHELRTPLTPVGLAVGQWQARDDLPAAMREDLAMMHRNLELEARLLEDLLDVNRILHGKLPLRREVMDLHQVIAQALAILSADIQAKQLQVVMRLDPEGCWIDGDAARVGQVIWNLLSNAIKFTSENGVITVSTARDVFGHILVQIADTGQGIEPELLPRLFQPFEQGGQQTTSRFGGLGLGLTICKSVAELHGGSISAHSDGIGRGTTMTVRLPTVPRPASAKSAPAGVMPKPTSGQGHRVLLVEDHPDTAKLLGRVLKAWGHKVRTAGSVAAAVQAADAEPFDLLVSDLGLPDGSGHDLMRTLSSGRKVRAIAVSGYGMDEDQQRSKDAGFAAHLTKPVDLTELREAITTVFQVA